MTPHAVMFEAEESATPRLFALRMQPNMVTDEPGARLRFPSADPHEAPETVERVHAPSPHTSTAGALRMPLTAALPLAPAPAIPAIDYELLNPIWDATPAQHQAAAYGSYVYEGSFAEAVRETAVSFSLAALRLAVVPVVLASALVVAMSPATGTIVPALIATLLAVGISVSLARSERRAFIGA